jgi:hypothetical protein
MHVWPEMAFPLRSCPTTPRRPCTTPLSDGPGFRPRDGNGFVQAEWLAAALTAGLGGTRPLAACLADYQRRRDAAMLPMYDFTIRLGSLTPDPAMQILLGSLVGRPADIDRLLGVFAGIVPIQGYFSARKFVRLLGVRRAARAVIAARTRPRPGSTGNGIIDATDSCVSATALCGSALELSDSCGMVLLQLPASLVVVEEDV